MAFTRPDLLEFQHQNELQLCSHPSCSRLRKGISRHCAMHDLRYYRFGHVDHQPIYPRAYREELDAAKAVIKINQSAPLIVKALVDIQDELEVCWNGCSPASYSQFLWKLRQEGKTAQDVLRVAAAVTALYYRPMQTFIRSDRHWRYQMGQIIFRLASHDREPMGKPKKELGEFLHNHCGLGLLYLSMTIRERLGQLEEDPRHKKLKTGLESSCTGNCCGSHQTHHNQ